eukprot:m.128847 g.128847  ORF g.128847 m.128847 type:complete len:276 (-) comp13878_c0_seq1:751-1578(-)
MESERIDFLSQLPQELVIKVLAFLPSYHDLFPLMLVSKNWLRLVNTPEVWGHHCDRLWEDKVYVAEFIRQQRQRGDCKKALKASLDDLDRRDVTWEEITSCSWQFRFKSVAGQWCEHDPWHHDLPAFKLTLLPDGVVQGFPGAEFKWALVPYCLPNPDLGKKGFRMHIFPTCHMHRYRKNWGIVLENCWSVYTNFEMPPRNNLPRELSDEYLPITSEKQEVEILLYNLNRDYTQMTQAEVKAVLAEIGVSDDDDGEDSEGEEADHVTDEKAETGP